MTKGILQFGTSPAFGPFHHPLQVLDARIVFNIAVFYVVPFNGY